MLYHAQHAACCNAIGPDLVLRTSHAVGWQGSNPLQLIQDGIDGAAAIVTDIGVPEEHSKLAVVVTIALLVLTTLWWCCSGGDDEIAGLDDSDDEDAPAATEEAEEKEAEQKEETKAEEKPKKVSTMLSE